MVEGTLDSSVYGADTPMPTIPRILLEINHALETAADMKTIDPKLQRVIIHKKMDELENVFTESRDKRIYITYQPYMMWLELIGSRSTFMRTVYVELYASEYDSVEKFLDAMRDSILTRYIEIIEFRLRSAIGLYKP